MDSITIKKAFNEGQQIFRRKSVNILLYHIDYIEAENKRLRQALEQVEWCGDYPYDPCLWCNGYRLKGHEPDCPRQAALAATEPKEVGNDQHI